ncbi:MAG: hypothetical protein QME96_14305, partial [Myxococcota bacterium]|nr:hypothetical protein [Myxococcota bacterium]
MSSAVAFVLVSCEFHRTPFLTGDPCAPAGADALGDAADDQAPADAAGLDHTLEYEPWSCDPL